MPDLSRMSGPKLAARYERLFEEGSRLCRELIAAGYGNERGSDTRARAAATGDSLAVRKTKNADEFNAVVEEQKARKRYHGGTHPIKRKF